MGHFFFAKSNGIIFASPLFQVDVSDVERPRPRSKEQPKAGKSEEQITCKCLRSPDFAPEKIEIRERGARSKREERNPSLIIRALTVN
jgi:hypothetical protein